MAMILRIVEAISQAPCSIGRICERLYSCLRTPVRLSQTLTEFSFNGFRVKDFFVHRCVRGLILPFVIVVCVLLAGFGSAQAAKNGKVEIGFKGFLATNSQYFQGVLLNVQTVRINPKANAGPGSGKWSHIPAPPGIGGSGRFAELQIDLNASQNIPQLFNTASVRADTYKVAEIRLDPNIPGYLIPNCPNAPSVPSGGFNSDGCVAVPITVTDNVLSVPIDLTAPSNGKTSALIIQLGFTIMAVPTAPGDAFTVSVVPIAPTNPSTGVITGTINVQSNPNPGTGTSTTGVKVRKLAVSALAVGTSNVLATAVVHNNSYTLVLPAAGGPAAPGFGSLYDIAISGGADSYQALRMPPLYPGQQLEADFKPTGSETLGNITGTISDGCEATKPVVGATLQLLLPPDTISNPPEGYCFGPPSQTAQCITVAVANTDNAGDFPLPGTVTIPSQFQNVPVAPNSSSYVMEISAPGYQTLFVRTKPGTQGKVAGTCSPDQSGSGTFTSCNLQLTKGYVTGAFQITPPPSGQTTLVQVFAEDHDTNNIESALPMPVTVTHSNNEVVNYTLNVPPNVPAFDLFATTIDLYQGVTDPYQGHNIVTVSDVPAPSACATVTAPTPPDQTIDCTGHGSITGTVTNPDLGTSVVLEKLDPDGPVGDNEVQITSSVVRNQPDVGNLTPTSNYSFCAPADTAAYQVQRVELLPTPVPSMTPDAIPTPEAVGTPISVTIPFPPPAGGGSPTPTPAINCPTTCSYPNGQCPGICNNVPAPSL
jgi:hypothetical protein